MAQSRATLSTISTPCERLELQVLLLVAVERRVVLDDVVVGGQEEAAGAAGRVADRLAGLRAACTSTIAWISGARREVLARAALGVLRRSSPAGPRRRRPSRRRRASIHFSRSIRSTISRRSLAGSWILFCALRKMTPEHARLLAQLFEDVAVVGLERRRRPCASRLGQS